MGIPEGEESEQGIENLFEEIMTENFPNLVKKKKHNSRTSGVPNNLVPKRPCPPRQTIIKMKRYKDKERILSHKRKADIYTQGSTN